MKVVLLERVERLGKIGDVVTVKDGFGRNFLLPRKKALLANDRNMKVFEAQRAEIEARNAAAREKAEAILKTLDGADFIVIRQAGESGQLYGSVSARDVAEAIIAAGHAIERTMVTLDKPIKTVGVHSVRVRLHGEVTASITANVARTTDEAERQAKGENVIAADIAEDKAAAAEQAAVLLEASSEHMITDF
jgi:large subunit ribosomal protein L9